MPGDEGWIHISPDRREIIGYNPDRMNVYDGKDMGPQIKNFSGYFVLQFDKPFDEYSAWEDSSGVRIYDGKEDMKGPDIGALVTFPASGKNIVKVRIGS